MDMSYSKIRPRRGSVSELGLANPILALGEIVIEYPENGIGNGYCRIKIGDGERHYDDLSYALDGLQANSVVGGDAGNPSGFLSIRGDTTSKWGLSDPVIGKGEIVYDQTKNGIKIGDGEHCFSELDYIWAQGNIKGVKGSAEPGYQTGYVIIDPRSIGLENVDNTHDKDKSVKYAESANKDADGNVISTTYARVTDLNALKTQIDNFISTSGHYVTDTQLTNIINQVNTRITNVSQMITNGNYLSKTEADQYYPSKTELDTLKNSVSNGKASVANAITAKGVSTATTAEFSTMASNIAKIETGGKIGGALEEFIKKSYVVPPYQSIYTPDGTLGKFGPSRTVTLCDTSYDCWTLGWTNKTANEKVGTLSMATKDSSDDYSGSRYELAIIYSLDYDEIVLLTPFLDEYDRCKIDVPSTMSDGREYHETIEVCFHDVYGHNIDFYTGNSPANSRVHLTAFFISLKTTSIYNMV